MMLSDVYDECLKRFESKGLKAEQLQLTTHQLNIVLPQGTIHVEENTHTLSRPITIEAPTKLLSRRTHYVSFNRSFFARIEEAIDNANKIYIKDQDDLQAHKAIAIKLNESLIPYIKEYGDVFEVRNGAIYIVLGETPLRINLKTEKVLLMSYAHSSLHLPIHLFIPLLKEMELEQLLGA